MKLLAMFSDLFIQSRITELVEQNGGEVRFAVDAESAEKLLDIYKPDLILLDLASSEYGAFSIAPQVRKLSGAKLFGIFPHVRKDLRKKADEEKFDFVVPNSGFLTTLRRILSEKATNH